MQNSSSTISWCEAAQNTSTSSTTEVYPKFPMWGRVLAFLPIELVAIPSLAANLLVFCTILANQELRDEPTYLSMLVLAIADGLHACIAIVPVAGSILIGSRAPTPALNKVFVNITYPTFYITCLSYCTIAVNRWLIICYPQLNQKIFSKRNTVLFICSWPFLVLGMLAPILSGQCCLFDFNTETWHIVQLSDSQMNVQFCVCYSMASLTTLISYISYPCAIHKIRKISNKVGNNATAFQASKKVQSAEMRVLVQFLAISVVFTFTWITRHFEAQLIALRTNVPFGYAGLFGYAVISAVNPIIYFTMNATLRSACAKFLRRLARREPAISISLNCRY